MPMVRMVPVDGNSLYVKYLGETDPQPVYVSLDASSGEFCARASLSLGHGVPVRVWQGHIRRWRIPPLRERAANVLLETLCPLAQRICNGYTVAWRGPRSSVRFSEDASSAIDEMASACSRVDPGEMVSVWTAREWFASDGSRHKISAMLGILPSTSDAELRKIADALSAQAQRIDVDRIDGLYVYLQRLRSEVAPDRQLS